MVGKSDFNENPVVSPDLDLDFGLRLRVCQKFENVSADQILNLSTEYLDPSRALWLMKDYANCVINNTKSTCVKDLMENLFYKIPLKEAKDIAGNVVKNMKSEKGKVKARENIEKSVMHEE